MGGAVAILRVSGPDAFSISKKILEKSAEFELANDRILKNATLVSGARKLDHALFVKFKNPRSFTGEDVVEFHIHGGAFIASEILSVLIMLGARQALPGEFSFRGVQNRKFS